MGLFRKKYWNYHGFHTKTKSFYDENGYDIRGYDEKGYDKKGYDIHGFDIKGIHKKTKTKFDEDGYDKQRFGRDGYAKDGSKKNQSDNGRHNLSKNISKDLIENWQRKNPPDNSGPNSIYFVTWSWALTSEFIKNKRDRAADLRMFLPDDMESNSKEDKEMIRKLIEKFGTQKISPELGELTEKGHDLYLSLLHVIGKNTVCGAPKKKSKLVLSYQDLYKLELVNHDRIEREFFLSSKGAVMLQVLALALSSNSTPHIG